MISMTTFITFNTFDPFNHSKSKIENMKTFENLNLTHLCTNFVLVFWWTEKVEELKFPKSQIELKWDKVTFMGV